jgi:SEC-C motif-containing protein
MRSRFAAFALRDDEYLWRTLHPDHEDRARPRDLYRRAVRGSAARYMSLEVLDRSPPDEAGMARVLFLANVFEKGRDISFVELSEFLHDGDGFRYLGGLPVPKSAIRGAPDRLTIETFNALYRR